MKIVTTTLAVMNQFLIAVILTIGLLYITNPTAVGYWQAQRDIGYDSIWSEYVSDCDCTEALE
jgi:hypothetical protein